MSSIRSILTASLLAIHGPLLAQEPAAAAPSNLADSLDPSLDSPLATDLPAEPAPPPAKPATNVAVNLINLLVKKGTLSQVEASALIEQAEAEAATAPVAAARADVAALPPILTPEEETRITYIPQVVRDDMRDQIQQELMAQASKEKWGQNAAPEWTSKFRPFGDIRVRSENVTFGEDNADNGSVTNFNSINTGAPYDSTNTLNNFPPQINVNEIRHRTRIRVRAGTDIKLGDGFNGGLRIATGDSNSPVSPNQTLGGNGGNFSKYAIWLDRAFFSYDAGPGDGQELLFMVGRFDSPFMSTDVHWDEDLGFDGLAVRGKVKLNERASTFFTAGYFPFYNTDFNFASNQPSKFESTDKWLTGAQLGIDWKIKDDLTAKVAIAYYDFDGAQGVLSDPFVPLSAADAGNTDTTRPGFAQRGNTYMPLRNITPTAANGFGTTNQFQYYGLASEFRNLTITGKLEYDGFEPFRLTALGEVTKNLGFDRGDVASRAFSDGRPGRTINTADDFQGGDMAWNVAFQFGNPALEKFGDWYGSFGYRYVESDAVIDGFTDSNFGRGATNVQGFTLGGTMALTPAVRLGLRWLSSDEIDGPPLSTDTFQLDLSTKF